MPNIVLHKFMDACGLAWTWDTGSFSKLSDLNTWSTWQYFIMSWRNRFAVKHIYQRRAFLGTIVATSELLHREPVFPLFPTYQVFNIWMIFCSAFCLFFISLRSMDIFNISFFFAAFSTFFCEYKARLCSKFPRNYSI